MPESHEFFLREAIRLSELSVEHGNEPFGALLVRNGEVILTAENSIHTEHDVTCHAELNLVSQATRTFDRETLSQCTLYTSTEPCAMCATSIYWAGIPRVVFACSSVKLAEFKKGGLLMPSRELYARGKRSTEVIGPILEEEAAIVHAKYFKLPV